MQFRLSFEDLQIYIFLETACYKQSENQCFRFAGCMHARYYGHKYITASPLPTSRRTHTTRRTQYILLRTGRPVPRRTHTTRRTYSSYCSLAARLPAGNIRPPTLPRLRNVWHLTHTHAAALHQLFPVPGNPWTHTGCITATNPTPTWSGPNLPLRLRARPRIFTASIRIYISIYNYKYVTTQ